MSSYWCEDRVHWFYNSIFTICCVLAGLPSITMPYHLYPTPPATSHHSFTHMHTSNCPHTNSGEKRLTVWLSIKDWIVEIWGSLVPC